MSDNLGAQPGCHLLALPSEVRLLIYEMIFPHNVICLCALAAGFHYHDGCNLALLATCRTIRAEAEPVFYENTLFSVWWNYNPEAEPVKDEDALSNVILEARPKKRKLSLQIRLTEASMWANTEDKARWYGKLTSELTLLGEAPHLKDLHIELNAPCAHGIAAELYQMISLLGRVISRVNPTISISPSLRYIEFDSSTYFDSIAKLNWVDVTHGVYSMKLASMVEDVSLALRTIQSKSTWVAAKSAEHRDTVNNENFNFENLNLRKQARSIADEIGKGLANISDLESEVAHLEEEIKFTKEDMAWIAEERSTYESAKASIASTSCS